MKKISNIKFISLILAFIMLVSSINVFASTGSTIGPKSMPRITSFKSHSSAKGFASTTYGFRIRAFDVSEFSGGDYSYFTVSQSANGNKVSLVSNILNAEGYSDNASWIYVTPLNKSRKYSFYLGGDEFTTKSIGNDSSQMKQLKNILGINDFRDYKDWDKAFRSYNNFGETHAEDDELAKFLGITPGHYYFYIVEGLRAMYDPDASVTADDFSDKFIFTSYQDYIYDSSAKDIMSCQTPIDKTADSCLRNPDYYINQGDLAPFGLEWAEGQPIKTGFGVYGDINGSSSEPFSLNIAVEYKGLPNTSDGEFVSATSLIKQEGGTYSYWDVDQGKWIETTDNSTILQTTKGVDTDYPYTVVLEDNYYIENASQNITASNLIKSGDQSNSGYSITWGSTAVNSGDINVGYSVKPTALNSKNSTSAIMDKFVSVLNNNTVYDGRVKNDNYANLSILEACLDNVNRAYLKTDNDAVGQILSSGETKLRNGKKLGTAVELIVKGSEVTSHKVTVAVDVNGIASSSETWSDTYSSAGSTKVDIDSNAVCFITVPNSNRNDEAVTSALSGVVDVDANSILTRAKSALVNTKLSQVNSNVSIGLGCEPNLEGYTVYEIIVADKEVKGENIELPAYMLNRYFRNIIQTSSNGQIKYQVNKDFTAVVENYPGSKTCERCGANILHLTKPVNFDDWNIEWIDVSKGTIHTDYDNELRGRYFINMGSETWKHANRVELANWVSEDTRNWSNPSGYIMDYGFNLIRASVDDNRAISGISYANYESVDSDNLLRYKDYFGVIPAETKSASSKRNSLAVVGTVSDTLTLQSRFEHYKGNGYNDNKTSHDHEEVGHWTHSSTGHSSHYVVDKPAVHISYYEFFEKNALGFRKNANAVETLEYTFDSTVYKYETDELPVGKNSKISGDNAAISTSAHKSEEGIVGDTNEYRFANVRNNGVVHNFYPEVNMITCIGDKDWKSVVDTGYKSVMTMGEVMRQSESSSMYLFKINGIGKNSVTGTTYSDSAQGGTATIGSKRVTIPAGADVYVAADPKGVTIDLYGYALDCINKDFDSKFKVNSNYTRDYNEVVKSYVNVDEIWNGHSNKVTLVNNFADWTAKILDVENFAADFELYTDNTKKAHNFSAVVGNIKRNTTISEDGVYQLQVANGVVLKNTDYNCLIKQIASDYECSENEAEALFKASGVYTSILNAIESSTSSFNKSGVCDLNSAWTAKLGNTNSWYDEKVNTFVIRRFTCKGNQIQSITAVDKVDFGLANDGNSSSKQNSNAGNVVDASWKLNLFFNPDKADTIKDLLVGSGKFYNPGEDAVSLDDSKNSYTLILNKVPVEKADFNISASNTSDFRY